MVARTGIWLLASLALLTPAIESQNHGTGARPGRLDLQVAPVFTDHMVVQRDQPIRVFGTATPAVAILVRFAGNGGTTTAAPDGTWSVTLPPQPAERRPRPLIVEAGKDRHPRRVFRAVCGDVWLCAGQSNMRWQVNQTVDADEIKERANLPDLRLLDYQVAVPMGARAHPPALLRKLTPSTLYERAQWQPSTTATASRFSAVAHAFGRRLVGEIGVPIGLIHIAVGGAPMEAFLSPEIPLPPAIETSLTSWLRHPDYPNWCQGRAKVHLQHWPSRNRAGIPPHPFAPYSLYRSGIAPLAGFSIRGVLWYQGESNATGIDMETPANRSRNDALLRATILTFRSAWADPRLPFYFVQLPGMRRAWAPFRQVQLNVARTVPNIGMAITMDLGHPTNVHPRDKTPVGHRLARLALAGTYGRKILPNGPIYRSHTVVGREVCVHFDHSSGLMTTDDRAPVGFELAGPDGIFRTATARIGNGNGEPVIVLTARAVESPVAVRYAFAADPRTNLINAAGVPASPFAIDPQ